MKPNFTYHIVAILFVCCCLQTTVTAQVIIPPSSPTDTVRVIQILQGRSLRKKLVDTISYQTIAGEVQLKEGLTIFNCDSAAINESSSVVEAFGNIHINQQDSIHTYSKYLKYIGKDRIAYLKKDVRLTDKKGTLYTQEMEYDLKTNIAKYQKGGRVVNGKTVLTSQDGVYYADTKDVYFKKNVHLVDPKYDITTDSLLYNTQSQVATFITATHIKGKNGGDIYTSSGTYDLKNGKAFFGSRPVIKDSTRIYTGDIVAYDEISHIAQLEGNAVVRDSVNGFTVTGGQIFLNEQNGTFLASRKPVLIFKGEGKDSTFIAADTLFSGIEKRDSKGNKILEGKDTLTSTTIVDETGNVKTERPNGKKAQPKAESDSSNSAIEKAGNEIATAMKPVIDSITAAINDSLQKASTKQDSAAMADYAEQKLSDTTLAKPDARIVQADSISRSDTAARSMQVMGDTLAGEKNKLLQKDTSINLAKDTAIRYFQAFHHVRIFNDSVQAVCDSLWYSSADSIFRMYQEPLVFSNKSQIAGDTIHLYTKNKKAERVYVFENSLLVNEVNPRMYNQIGGRTMNGYFKEGVLDYVRTKGSPAESIFYPQDEDSSITGMNRCKGDVIDIYFIDKTVNKVKFINDVDGILYPLHQVPEDQKQLNKFKWLDARRPKNKLELFE